MLNADGVTALKGLHRVDLATCLDGRFLYTVNAGAGSVSMFRFNQSDGSLTDLGEIEGLPEDNGAADIAAR